MNFVVLEHSLHLMGATLILTNLAIAGMIVKNGGRKSKMTQRKIRLKNALSVQPPMVTANADSLPTGANVGNPALTPSVIVDKPVVAHTEHLEGIKNALPENGVRSRKSQSEERKDIRKPHNWRFRASVIAHACIACGAIFGLMSVERHHQSPDKNESNKIIRTAPTEKPHVKSTVEKK